jgi:hypothetical protein
MEQDIEKILVIDPFSGAAGDMLLASLIDAGLDVERLADAVRSVPGLSGVGIESRRVKRGLFQATYLEVSLPEESAERSLADIEDMIARSSLPAAVKKGSIDTFRLLAEAEARVHGCPVSEIHFHEVGGLDAIFDIVGWHSALAALGSPACYYTRIVLGTGSTSCRHGEIPLPAPATTELLKDHEVSFSRRERELVTPTAAAIIAGCFRPLGTDASLVLEKTGYGAGSLDPDDGPPNVLRTMLGSRRVIPSYVCIARSTIDDMNPEVYGFLMEKLFSLGALEVYYHPVMMKKNRPGTEITVLADEDVLDAVIGCMLEHTTTLGLRISREQRVELAREVEDVETPLGKVKVKIAHLPGGGVKMSPEYESCRSLAEKTGARILEVFEAARSAWEGRKR